MVFASESNQEILILIHKDSRNIWDLIVAVGNEDEYIRHDYIFTDAYHGYKLIGMIGNSEFFGNKPDWFDGNLNYEL